jgi:hypothetical protein
MAGLVPAIDVLLDANENVDPRASGRLHPSSTGYARA